jgi:hypothetical protein
MGDGLALHVGHVDGVPDAAADGDALRHPKSMSLPMARVCPDSTVCSSLVLPEKERGKQAVRHGVPNGVP